MKSGKVGKVIVTIGLANVTSEDFHYVKGLVDTGADETVIPLKLANELRIKSRREIQIDTGNGLTKVGVAPIAVMLNDHLAFGEVWISEKIGEVLIGVIVLESLGLKVNPKNGTLEEEKQTMYLTAR